MSTAAPQVVTKYPHATFCWVEAQTSDAEGGKRFYTELFGWDAQDDPLPDGSHYTTFMLHGKPVAGFYAGNPMIKSGQIPPHWGSSIAVNDIEAIVSKVEEAGGKVVMAPFDVMDAGRMAYVQDPTDAVFSLWEAREMIGAYYVNIPNTFIWNELMTHDLAAATAFYGKLLGWTSEVDTSGPRPYTIFKNGERMAAGAMAITPDMGEMPANWSVYFDVEDCDASVAKIKELGGNVLVEPFDTPAGRIAVVQDPQGAVFNVMKSSYADPPPQG